MNGCLCSGGVCRAWRDSMELKPGEYQHVWSHQRTASLHSRLPGYPDRSSQPWWSLHQTAASKVDLLSLLVSLFKQAFWVPVWYRDSGEHSVTVCALIKFCLVMKMCYLRKRTEVISFVLIEIPLNLDQYYRYVNLLSIQNNASMCNNLKLYH